MKNTNQKVVIITGASSGIGLATANLLLEKGMIVYGIARTYADTRFKLFLADVCDSVKISEIFEQIYKEEGRIDVVVNNAGIGISGAIENTPKQLVEKIFDVNVVAVVDICKIAIPYLRKTKGRILNTSSVASIACIPFQACYSATKASIEGFSLSLAKELMPQGIKICCVRPGDTKTGFTDSRIKNQDDQEIYGDFVKKKTEKMEKYERNGDSPTKVAKVMYKCIKKKNPPLVCSVGFGYKLICVLLKVLPARLANYLVYKIY